MESNFFVQAEDGAFIYTVKWTGIETKPKLLLQIAHGMAEHIHRYEAFAEELLAEGIFVYGNDHRGHGQTAKQQGEKGYFADENGFERVVDDMLLVTKYMQHEYPGVPIVLFGHSMGSFLARRYAQRYGGELNGLILSGTGDSPKLLLQTGRWLARAEMAVRGGRTRSPFLNKLSFGQFNKKFQPNRTDFDWLSRDEREVDRYIADPLCGGIFTSGFFYDLFTGNEVIQRQENIRLIPKELPVLFVSGDRDPVGDNTKGVLHAYEALKEAGMQRVAYMFYEGARHEVLNETNRSEVYDDLKGWLLKL